MQAQSCCPQPAGEASEWARVMGVPSCMGFRGSWAVVNLRAYDSNLEVFVHSLCIVTGSNGTKKELSRGRTATLDAA
jgi:hypothetical protein